MHGRAALLGDIRQGDLRRLRRRKLLLGLLRRFFDPGQRHKVIPQIDALGAGRFLADPIDHPLVKIVAAQVIVAGGGQHLDHAFPDLDHRHVEGAAAQIVHHHLLGRAGVQAVSQGRAGGFVDDALHIQPGDGARVLGGLPLNIIKIGGHGDHRVGDRFAQIAFRVGSQFAQDHGADFLGRPAFAVDIHAPVRAHLPLDRRNGALGVHRGLMRRRAAHKPGSVIGEGHHGRGGALAFIVGDDHRVPAFHDGNAAVGGA